MWSGDLLRLGVFMQADVSTARPRRAAAAEMAVAGWVCSPPQQQVEVINAGPLPEVRACVESGDQVGSVTAGAELQSSMRVRGR